MKTQYKILIVSILIISIFSFLHAPLIIGQPECNDEIINIDYDCDLWSNWDWIYYNLFENYFILTIPTPSHEWDTGYGIGAWTGTVDVVEDELYQMGCNQSILVHLANYSNLLDEGFDGVYAINDVGLPDGVSTEKFKECVDIIFEKRTMGLEHEN